MEMDEPKPEVKKPEHLDLRKAKLMAEKIIRENKPWLKEMADK
jgi:hypothetical protein